MRLSVHDMEFSIMDAVLEHPLKERWKKLIAHDVYV